IVALNKVDALPPEELAPRIQQFEDLLPGADLSLTISATRGDNRQQLLDEIIQRLPEGPRYYPAEHITDRYERDITADFIRAAAMELLREELPHSIAVRIDEFNERGEEGAYIAATIFVERESQKGIVIGKGGSMIREIGTQARQAIEEMSGRSVYLDLRVKVLAGWRNDPEKIRQFDLVSGT
ncbi:MAG: GTPase Era, partial [Anaerolineales bacterium]|nr:GTPase Era [Anaerolineales bacterium]